MIRGKKQSRGVECCAFAWTLGWLCACDTWRHTFPQLGFWVFSRKNACFGSCFHHRLWEATCAGCFPSVQKNGWTRSCLSTWWNGFEREKILAQFWRSCVRDEFDLTNSIQTKAAFSFAVTVMNRIGGWRIRNEEGSQIRARFAACIVGPHQGGYLQIGQQHMEAESTK